MALRLLLLLLLVVFVNVSLLANSQTTTFCYSSFDPKPDALIYSGDAHTVPGFPFLRLTKNVTYSNGQVFYSKPVKFWETGRKPNFLTVFSINIRPPSPFPDSYPESFVFWIESIDNSPPRPFVSLSAKNFSSSVFVNDDPSDRYIRIRINHKGFKSSTTGTGLLYATIKYDGEAARLTRTLSNGVETLTESLIIDFTRFFTQQVRVGIEAFNVQSVAVHDLLSWYFTSTLVNVGENAGIKQYV